MGRKINKGLVFGIVLVAVAIVFAVAMTMNTSANGPESPAGQGITLITEPYIGRVIEVDSSKNIVWNSSTDPDPPIEMSSPYDAERLANGNTLITDYFMDRVIEIDSSGDIKWEMTGLVHPVDAERLENGNTLITEPNKFRVIEVDSSKTIIWDSSTYPTTPIVLNLPQDAERLENGNTLITDTFNGRVIEVDSDGTIFWDNTDPALVLVNDPFDLILPWDAERIENDITLITETGKGRVIEVDRDYNIVVVKDGLFSPYDAERLANGNTLITEAFGPFGGRVIEVDRAGVIQWEKTGLVSPWDVERFVPPVADAGPDQVVPAGDECLAMVTLDGTASSHPIGHPLAYTWTDSFGEATGSNPTVTLGLGTHTIMLKVDESYGGTDTDTVVITVNDTTPPVLTVPIDLTVEQTSPEGTPVDIGRATATDNCNEEITITNDAPLVFPLGQTVITWMATDDSDNVTTGIQKVTVEDTTPPEINVTLSPDVLWPHNHKMVAIAVNVEVNDICDPTPSVVLTSVLSNEPDDAVGNGDGNTKNDIQDAAFGTEDYEFLLRAERSGRGSGRVYQIVYTVTDASGNSTSGSAIVTVPHDKK